MSQCACRRHRGGTVVDTSPVETVGQPFEAGYAGQCVACPVPISPGELIARAADEAGYVHYAEGCAS